MSRERDHRLRSLYREFKDYIDNAFYDDPNAPGVSVGKCPDEEGIGIVEFLLINTSDIYDTVAFATKVNKFRPGTKTGAITGVKTGAPHWTAQVPIEDTRYSTLSNGPNPLVLIGWFGALVSLLGVSWKFTSWEEWGALFSLIKR